MSTIVRDRRKRGRPRDPERVRQKRKEILHAAAQCFGQDGYANTDLNRVAQTAGITKGTIYHYFDSKEDLFFATADYEVYRLRKRVTMAADACEDPLDELAAVIYTYLRFFEDNPYVVELFVEERSTFKDRKKHTYFVHRDITLPRWHELMRRLVADGRISPVDPEGFISVLSDTLYGTVFTNYFAGTKLTAAEQTEQIIGVAFSGVLLEPHTFRFGETGAQRTPLSIAGEIKYRTAGPTVPANR